VSRIELAPEVADDLERILDHLLQFEIADAPSRIGDIFTAIDVLAHNPLIGRIVRPELRELVIGRRARGYIALYRYVAELDTVFVLAIRGQKEAGAAPL
jgi:plasmid stabilization system protein ParE